MKAKRHTNLIYSLSIVFLLITQNIGAAQITSTFDTDLDGWSAFGAIIDHAGTGGNPGGYLRTNDLPNESFIQAPGKFLGDLSMFNGGTLSFDINVFSTHLPPAGQGGKVTLISGLTEVSYTVVDIPSLPVPSGWVSGSVALTSSVWGVSESDWEALLSNVTAIEIIVDPSLGANNLDVSGFDNFRIQAVPIPSALLLLGSGVLSLFGVSFRKLS